MNNNTLVKSIFAVITIVFLLIFTTESRAIPTFARQTNLACNACHTNFPELNAFGRTFKLNGYTLIGSETIQARDSLDNLNLNLEKTPPVSLMLQAAYTYLSKEQPGTKNNNVSLPQQFSLFLAGEITPHIGGFIQVTYDDQSATFGMDNADLRYANQTSLGSSSLLYGLTLNNNPTVQDIWNSTPAWSFPYATSSVAVSPMAATMIEGGLAQNVAGLGAYALFNDLIYGEVSVYRSAPQGGPHPPDSTASMTIKTLAPYWRLAIQKGFDDNYVEIGTFGMSTELYPAGITGSTDKYTDIGFDLNYEKPVAGNEFAVRGSYINEKRDLNSTFNGGGSLTQSLTLNSFKVIGSFYAFPHWGFSFGYFAVTGDADSLLYAPAATSGSSTGSPNSSGIIGEISYLPWMNTKLSLQYIAYNKFNGGTDNYDGSGRNASDNNSLYLLAWVAF